MKKPSKDYDMPASTAVEDIREIKEILNEILKEKLLQGQLKEETGKVSQGQQKDDTEKQQNCDEEKILQGQSDNEKELPQRQTSDNE